MTIFESERLSIQQLQTKDEVQFIELLSAPEIINPIPQEQWDMETILEKFQNSMADADPKKSIWGIYEKGNDTLIGLCVLLTNDEEEREIGYRFRQKYWGKGYGTEVAGACIRYVFEVLNLALITADVNIANTGSVKILEKFLHPVREFYNEKDQCTDRRYKLSYEQWQAQQA